VTGNGSLLAAENLSYGRGQNVLVKGVNLQVERGTWLGVVGPNGAGKTTLLKLLSGTILPFAGEVRLKGTPLRAIPSRLAARSLAFLPQDLLEAPISLYRLVALGRYPYNRRTDRLTVEDERVITEVMGITNTAALAHRLVSTLSGGERQRAYLAQALAQEPEVLLLDEPTAHLDLRAQIEVLEMLTRLRAKGLTLISVMHDLEQAVNFCDTILIMNDGESRLLDLTELSNRDEVLSGALGRPLELKRDLSGWHVYLRYPQHSF
jgi:iron complex transport system ATP-binding protein